MCIIHDGVAHNEEIAAMSLRFVRIQHNRPLVKIEVDADPERPHTPRHLDAVRPNEGFRVPHEHRPGGIFRDDGRKDWRQIGIHLFVREWRLDLVNDQSRHRINYQKTVQMYGV